MLSVIIMSLMSVSLWCFTTFLSLSDFYYILPVLDRLIVNIYYLITLPPQGVKLVVKVCKKTIKSWVEVWNCAQKSFKYLNSVEK